jgi:ABC-type multidrug transport system fused ATPase/permease subunit
LDDAFSNLDSGTEEEILGNIQNQLQDTTTLIISHRISAVQSADKIIVMDSGKILEQGNHTALIQQGGIYARLFESQSLAQEMEILL